MIELVGPYFERHRRGEFTRGGVFEALIPYSGDDSVSRLRVVSAGDGPPWCEVEDCDLDAIRQSDPEPELNLKRAEAMITRMAKCRRVILLSTPPDRWQSGPRRSDDVYLVSPIYRFQRSDPTLHISRVKAYAYNTLFYLPPDEERAQPEACVRLDRVQPIHRNLLDPKPLRLTAKALDALTAWYGCYLTGRIPERIRTYRETALAQLRPE